MRRIASNTGSQCSPASDSMCAHSPASSALAGWTRSPRASSSAVAGDCASQSISRPGRSTAQLARDREIAPGVPEADRRRHEERARRARGRAAARSRGGAGGTGLAQQQVDAHRIARVGRVAAALQRDQPAARLARPLGAFGVRAGCDRRCRGSRARDSAHDVPGRASRASLERWRVRRSWPAVSRSCRSPTRGRSRSAGSSAAPGTSRRRTTRRSPRSRAARRGG